MDDFEGVFEKKICRFIWAKCHIKLSHAIYMYSCSLPPINQEDSIQSFVIYFSLTGLILVQHDERGLKSIYGVHLEEYKVIFYIQPSYLQLVNLVSVVQVKESYLLGVKIQ